MVVIISVVVAVVVVVVVVVVEVSMLVIVISVVVVVVVVVVSIIVKIRRSSSIRSNINGSHNIRSSSRNIEIKINVVFYSCFAQNCLINTGLNGECTHTSVHF